MCVRPITCLLLAYAPFGGVYVDESAVVTKEEGHIGNVFHRPTIALQWLP